MAVGKILLAVSLTGSLTVGALVYDGGENLQAVKSYAESMKEKIAGLASDIHFLNSNITSKNDKINHQKGRIGELEAMIANLTAERDTLQQEVAQLTVENERIPLLETQIAALDTQILVLKGQVSGLETQLATLQADYTTATTELDKANSAITEANQKTQELKDYAATLESEATSAYNSAVVDRSNPMYAVEETDLLASIQGLHWMSPGMAINSDQAVIALMEEFMQADAIAGDGDYGWVLTITNKEPVLNDGKMDALMEYIANNSDLDEQEVTATFKVSSYISDAVGGYIFRADYAAGKYVVEKF